MDATQNPKYFWILLAAGAAGLVLLRLFDPATSHLFPPCPLRALTGWYCPGCGSLRALHQLLLGNFRAAFALNPFAVISLPFLLYGAVSYASYTLRGKYLPRVLVPAPWIQTLAVALLMFTVARNLPVYPFVLLAPR